MSKNTYNRVLHFRKDKKGNLVLFISKYVSVIDVPYHDLWTLI